MEFNPHNQKYSTLMLFIKEKQERINAINAELAWYAELDIAAAQSQYTAAHLLWQQQNQQLKNLQQSVLENETARNALLAAKKSSWNPMNWFNPIEKAKRVQIKGLSHVIAELQAKETKQKETCQRSLSAAQSILQVINTYEAMQPETLRKERDYCTVEQQKSSKELVRVKQLKEAADHALATPLANLQKKQAQLVIEKNTLSQASNLEHRLNQASNGYERKCIHEESGRILGDGRPGGVAKKAQSAIQRLSADIVKLEKRLLQIKHDFSRDIRTLVIDGNNMCYQGSCFVGVGPIRSLINELADDYQIKVIFDASIRKRLQANDKTISTEVDPNKQSQLVHVVATKQSADETILRTASDDKYCYVVSNDRYGDFDEMPCVIHNRLIRHEILDNKIFVHALGVATPFASAQPT